VGRAELTAELTSAIAVVGQASSVRASCVSWPSRGKFTGAFRRCFLAPEPSCTSVFQTIAPFSGRLPGLGRISPSVKKKRPRRRPSTKPLAGPGRGSFDDNSRGRNDPPVSQGTGSDGCRAHLRVLRQSPILGARRGSVHVSVSSRCRTRVATGRCVWAGRGQGFQMCELGDSYNWHESRSEQLCDWRLRLARVVRVRLATVGHVRVREWSESPQLRPTRTERGTSSCDSARVVCVDSN
jgi:hypothetical protein